MFFVSVGDESECQRSNRRIACRAGVLPHLRGKVPEQLDGRLAHGGVLGNERMPRAVHRVGSGYIGIFIKTGQGGLIVSRNAQCPVGKNSLRIYQVQ